MQGWHLPVISQAHSKQMKVVAVSEGIWKKVYVLLTGQFQAT